MEFFSTSFLSALLAIVVIDLVLAGDNAIVIGLAARSLPQHLQKKAILWGALGAVVIRALMTLAVVWLLKIPGLLLLGGGALLWIATKLTAEQAEDSQSAVMDSPQAPTAVGFRQAIQTIIMADVVMGVDNVLAIAGAAHGSFMLVVIGLLISIPIVMMGSTLVLKLVERFPIIIVFGAGVLGWTAAKMIIAEPLLATYLNGQASLKGMIYLVCIAAVVVVPLGRRMRNR